jgi:endonuclease III
MTPNGVDVPPDTDAAGIDLPGNGALTANCSLFYCIQYSLMAVDTHP